MRALGVYHLAVSDIASSIDMVQTRTHALRLCGGLLAAAALLGGVATAIVGPRVREASLEPGVAAALGVISIVSGTMLMMIVSEFRPGGRSKTERWATRYPVSTTWTFVLARSTTWLAVAMVLLLAVPSLSLSIRESTGTGWPLALTLSVISVATGACLGLLASMVPQLQNIRSRSSAGVSILAWICYSAASVAVLRNVFENGISSRAWQSPSDLLGWPSLIRLTVDSEIVNFVFPTFFTAFLLIGTFAVVRLPRSNRSNEATYAKRHWNLGRFPIMKLEMSRLSRHTKLRNHLVAMGTGLACVLAARVFFKLDESISYSVSSFLALMTGSLLIAKRGTLGRYPLPVRTLFSYKCYLRGLIVTNCLLVLLIAGIGSVVLVAIPGDDQSLTFLWRSCALVLGLSSLIGSSYIVGAHDSTGDLVTIGLLLAGFIAIGRLSDTHHVAISLGTIAIGVAASARIEKYRLLSGSTAEITKEEKCF